MAQIDLRSANVQLRDGYSKAGAINQPVTGPANGDTTITVQGFTVAITPDSEMRIVGSTRTYKVVSTVGGSTPTSITFTPALATADGIPVDTAVVTIGPHILNVHIGEGTLTYE